MDRIENPARFVLRADDGSIIQEYPLDKFEITIGRAPNSDILLSKDKLTSRRHATVRYENGNYVLRDERSANGTFVNGQQIEELVPRVLQEGDHIGIGEHELLFRPFGAPSSPGVEDLPTISVNPPAEMTYRTREDPMATAATSNDFSTHSMADDGSFDFQQSEASEQEAQPVDGDQPQTEQDQHEQGATPSLNGSAMPEVPEAAPSVAVATTYTDSTLNDAQQEQPPVADTSTPAGETPVTASQSPVTSSVVQTPQTGDVTFSRLTSISQPSLPDMTALMAAMSALDGQVMALQEQINEAQDALHNHDAEIAQTTNQLRSGVRRVMDRMDNTIADVARSREALAWADLSQLMEDVMNNPRDIEYVTKLARKARELNKIFQIHQNVLNTMYECNSLLRGLLGDDQR
jgi:predicted component of type VI protein secretion system